MFWLDTSILAILSLGAVFGAMSGLLWQVARFACVAAAVYAAIALNDQVSAALNEGCMYGADARAVRTAAYVIVFLAVYLVLFFATRLAYQGMEAVRLEPLDRLLGAVLGLGKAALLLAAVAWTLASFQHPKTRELLDQSTIAPALAEGMETVLQVIPPEVKAEVCDGLKSLQEIARGKAN
jgi:membrane protein required for colicin V production